MSVNEAVYGAKANWKGWFSQTNLERFVDGAEPKRAVFPKSDNEWSSDLIFAVQSGKLPLNNPIEKSISFMGVGNGSWLTDLKWSAWGTNKKTGEYFADKFVCKMMKKKSNPLGYTTLSSNSILYNTVATDNPYNSFWGYDQTYKQNSGSLTANLFAYINVKNTYQVAFVKASNANVETIVYGDSYTTKNFDLYTYFKAVDKDGKHYYEKYPTILALYTYPVYDYKKPLFNHYRYSITGQTPTAFLLNEFEKGAYPYDNTEKPLNILTYQQRGWAVNDNTFVASSPLTNPKSTNTTDWNISHCPNVIAGTHDLWKSLPKTNNIMFLEYTNIHGRHYLDGTNWRILRWLDVATSSNANELYNSYMKQVAYLGVFYTDSWDYAINAKTWDLDHCFCGIIDGNGITNGEHSKGTENKNQNQWNWDSFDDNKYKPSKKPTGNDKEKPSSHYHYNSTLSVGLDAGNYYAMSIYELNVFKNWQHTITNPAGHLVVGIPKEGEYSYEELGYNLQFMFNGVYPEGQLLSLMYFPFLVDEELKRHSTLIPDSYINLGNTETKGKANWYGSELIEAKATKIDAGSSFVEMESGEYQIEEYYGDFRDYAPYASMSLIIPFHGTIELDAGTWYGHTINTRMIVDIITGASTTVIERDGIPVDTVQGQVGVPVNFIARNVGDYASTLISNSQSLNQQKFDNVKLGVKTIEKTASAVGKGVLGVAFKNVGLVGSAVGDLVNAGADVMSAREKYKNTEFQIEHNQADSTVISSNAPSVAQYLEMFPRLVIRYPTLMSDFNGETYGKTVGYACNIQDTIGNFEGFTVFSGADLTGLSCQEDIKTRIFGLLQQGVIL